jgi:hypothetical protein
MSDANQHSGGCLCGGVRYAVNAPLRGVIACHCGQCRRTSGHYAAMSNAPTEHLALVRSDTLDWYSSSPGVERGFCRTCGSNLFWRQVGSDTTSITAGTLDAPTGLAMEQHIYVADKSDYYTLDDDLPKLEAW